MKNRKELHAFFSRNGCEVNSDFLGESTLDMASRNNLSDLIEKYEGSKKIYEGGRFFGYDNDISSLLAFMFGIGQICNQEEWDLVFQTSKPKHLEAYRLMGYPYKSITNSGLITDHDLKSNEGFSDYCGRPAQTVFIEGVEFRDRYEKIQKECRFY